MNLHIISAGAGSGKTYTLTKLMADLLRVPADSPESVRATGIIATTFTTKSAAELKLRVRARLLADGLNQQANDLDNAYIGTVHSIGTQFLKRFAFEVGISPNVEVLAEEDSKHLFNQSLATVLSPENQVFMQAISERLGFDKSATQKTDWRKELQNLIDEARANNLSLEQLDQSRQHTLANYLSLLPTPSKQSFGAWYANLKQVLHQTILALNQNADTTKGKQDLVSDLESVYFRTQNQQVLNWYEFIGLEKILKKATVKSRQDCEQLLTICKEHWEQADFHKDISDFVEHLYGFAQAGLEKYAAYKNERGLIDYIDMEVLWLKLLQNPTVREVLSEQLDLLLVDEFQDTNPIQLSIFLELSKLVKKAIWVGDMKQSIYGFRGAAPTLMQAIMQQAGENIQVLEYSWRSREGLVNTVNGLFSKAFAPDMPENRIVLKPAPGLETANEPDVFLAPVWHWEFEQLSDKRGAKRPNEKWSARALAESIATLLKRGVQIRHRDTGKLVALAPSDIAVLCAKNSECQEVAQALAQAGVGASIARQKLLQTPEARFVLACLKFVLNEYDTLSIAEILRLGTNLELSEIIDNRLEFMQTLQTETTEESPRANRNPKWGTEREIIQKLSILRTRSKELAASEILDWVLEHTETNRTLAAWSSPSQRLANMEALRAYARDYENSCQRLHTASTLGGFILWLEKLARNDQDAQAQTVENQHVQVLTYHRAKGLEWSVCVCYGLSKTFRDKAYGVRTFQQKADIDINAPLAGRLVEYWLNPYSELVKDTTLDLAIKNHPNYQKVRKEALREEIRLLYVGMTRARDYLILPTFGEKKTAWLNRVFHDGAEDTPTLLGIQNQLPWLWQGETLPLVREKFQYTEDFNPNPLPQTPVYHLPAYAGEALIAAELVETPRWILPPHTAQIIRTHKFAPPLVLPSDEEFKTPYETVSRLFDTLLFAYNPLAPQSFGLEVADLLLTQYALGDWFKSKDLVARGEAFGKFLFNTFGQDFELKKFYPFTYHNSASLIDHDSASLIDHNTENEGEQKYVSQIAYWIRTSKNEHIFISLAKGQTGNFHQHKGLAIEQTAHLYAAAHCLCPQNLDTARYLVLFGIEGFLYELGIEKVGTQVVGLWD